jgi:hypothetical protein
MKALIERTQAPFTSFAERSQFISKLLSEALPPPVDFIESFSTFTSELKKNLSPVLTTVFPSTFEVLNRLFEQTQATEGLVTKQIENSAITNQITANISQLKIATDGFEALRNGSLVREFSVLNQELARVADVPRELIQLTKEATAFFTSIQDGTYAKTLNEVAGLFKKYDDPIAELTKATAEQGAAFLTQLYNGNFSKANEDFNKAYENFQNNPGTLKLNQFFERLTSLAAPGDVTEEAAKIISDVGSGELRGSFTNVVKAEAEFRKSAFRKLVDILDGSGKFLRL